MFAKDQLVDVSCGATSAVGIKAVVSESTWAQITSRAARNVKEEGQTQVECKKCDDSVPLEGVGNEILRPVLGLFRFAVAVAQECLSIGFDFVDRELGDVHNDERVNQVGDAKSLKNSRHSVIGKRVAIADEKT